MQMGYWQNVGTIFSFYWAAWHLGGWVGLKIFFFGACITDGLGTRLILPSIACWLYCIIQKGSLANLRLNKKMGCVLKKIIKISLQMHRVLEY